MSGINRREFLQHSAISLAAVSTSATALAQEAPAKAAPSERIRMGCIGVAGRAAALLYGFASLKEVDVVRIADLDRKHLEGAVANLEKKTGKKPIADSDFRKLLDDNSLDAVAIGTPDHWHAIPTILAC